MNISTSFPGNNGRPTLTLVNATDGQSPLYATGRTFTNSNPQDVAVVDGSGNQITTFPISGSVTVTGNVASGASDSGNPVKIGGVYNTTLPTITNGQRADAQSDANAILMINNAYKLDATNDAVAIGDGTNTANVNAVANKNGLYVASNSATGSAVPANAFYIGVDNASGNLQGVASGAQADGATGNTALLASSFLWNGASYDKPRANFNTTTGDAPTITTATTTNGATQTNYNAAGAIITCILGAVSGASPSLALQLQYSPDAGTTWLTFGPASTALAISSNNTLAIAVYPTALTASLLGTTTAADNAQINAHLPRTWRLTFISTGTITSIAVSSVQVNYLL